MASTWATTQADPCFDGDVAPKVEDPFIDVEEALARFMHASSPPDAGGRAPASDRSADASICQTFAAGTLGAADLRTPIPREQRPLGKRDTLARVAIAVWLGASAIWAWQSYGGPATDIIAPPAPQTPNPVPEQAAAPPATEMSAPPARAALRAASMAQPATTVADEPSAASAERQQVEMRDLAALLLAVEQLAAGQEPLTRKIAVVEAAKPQAEKPQPKQPDKRVLGRESAHPAPTVAPPAGKPAPVTPMPPQAARRVSTVTALSRPPRSAPQMPSETQPANLPPLRPPIPVPQP
jgi:hypothetical protein